MFSQADEAFMQAALACARLAAAQDEVPVGAVVVKDDAIIASGWNQPIQAKDPCAHAEIIALRKAALVVGNYRLLETTLYVTLEPCLMCVGALVHARVKRVVFAACDPKAGAVQSQLGGFKLPFLNHQVHFQGGLLAEAGAKLMQEFFQAKRQNMRNLKMRVHSSASGE